MRQREAKSLLLRRWTLLTAGCALSIACGRSLTTGYGELESNGFGGSGGNAGSRALGGSGGGNPARGGTGGSPAGVGGTAVGGQGGFAQGGIGGQGGTTSPSPGLLWPCDSPVPLGNGLVGCENGMMHRPRSGEPGCLSELPRNPALNAADFAAIEQTAQLRGLTLEQILALLPCIGDSDCLDAPNGYCELADARFTQDLTQCTYGCVSDAECSSGQICLCGSPVGTCVSASCRRDADCGSGLLCTSHSVLPGCVDEDVVFACQTRADRCGGDGDCGFARPHCLPAADQQRVCAAAMPCP